MTQKKSKYKYDGPVYQFDKWICNWRGETWASSDGKALSNLAYRFKTQNNMMPNTGVKLDPDYLSELSAINELEHYHQMTLDELF